MQKTLVNITIISENQSAAIKNGTFLHTLSIIRIVVDVSSKLNKNFSVISSYFLKAFDRVDLNFVFSALRKNGYGEKSIHMIKVAYTNIQSNIKRMVSYLTILPLCEGFAKGFSTLDAVV